MAFVIAHLSDLHIGPLPKIPFRQLLNKRMTGALNWHSARATIHNMDVLAAVAADIVAQAPDHVALTGDLVNVGYEPEFPQALVVAKALGDPAAVSIVPGNHDAYVRNSLPAMERSFRPFMQGDGETGVATFPYLRVRDGVALIGVNSGVPTLPFMASGRIGPVQMEALTKILDETREQGLFRVIMIHHPPIAIASRFGRSLRDAKSFTRLMQTHGAELVLHGHNHRHSLHSVEGRTGPVPILGVASASAVPGTPFHRAEYHLVEIDRETRAIAIRRRGFSTRSDGVIDLAETSFPRHAA